MKEIINSTLAGIAVGAIFALIKAPVPAPPNLAGLMGIVGIFLGYVLVTRLI